jgi:hypothetical protein
MTMHKKLLLPSHLPAQPAKRSGQPPSKPNTLQPKTATSSATTVRKPVAPPVYRPQPTPKVLQTKLAGSPQAQTMSSRHKPTAPPVYRPQSVPKVLQRKIQAPNQPASQSKRTQVVPQVYRPLPVPKVLQKKNASGQSSLTSKAPRQPVAPPVYRPQPVPKVLQKKSALTPQSHPGKSHQPHAPTVFCRAQKEVVQLRAAVAVRALQTRYNSGVVQMMKIAKSDLEKPLWEQVSKWADGWDEFDTDDLSAQDREELRVILTTHSAGITNPVIKAELEKGLKNEQKSGNEVSAEQIQKELSKIVVPVPSLPPSSSSGGYIKEVIWEGPNDEKLNTIWKNEYGKSEKIYEGEPPVVYSGITNDPVIKLLFTNPSVFLEIIGWQTIIQPISLITKGEPARVITKVKVGLSLFQGNRLNVQTSFPAGMQHTSIGYGVNNGIYRIQQVHRHRSRKDHGPENFFIGMIKEQAAGVAKLGNDVVYDSDSIKSLEDGGYGYNVWPKMGFNGLVPIDCLNNMIKDETPQTQKGAAWLKGFCKERNGKVEFSDMFYGVQDSEIYNQLKLLWQKHGQTVNVVFDQRIGSKSWKTWEKYASTKGMGSQSSGIISSPK